jgi:hypothetical protein
MADETKVQAQAAAEAPAKVAETIASTATKVVKETAAVAKRERANAKRRTGRKAKVAKAAVTTSTRKAPRRAKRAAVKTAARTERTNSMKIDTNFFGASATPFQTLFADAGERGQEAFKRSQKAAQELAELTRANIEAFVDAGRIAVEATRALGQDVVAVAVRIAHHGQARHHSSQDMASSQRAASRLSNALTQKKTAARLRGRPSVIA